MSAPGGQGHREEDTRLRESACPSCGDPGYTDILGRRYCGNAGCDHTAELPSSGPAQSLEREVERLRSALSFYANVEFHGGDEGQIARAALDEDTA